jgi:hypothetical protein
MATANAALEGEELLEEESLIGNFRIAELE